ncbi:MAG: AAA family ATPase, partial [Pseudomonadota bacterium]
GDGDAAEIRQDTEILASVLYPRSSASVDFESIDPLSNSSEQTSMQRSNNSRVYHALRKLLNIVSSKRPLVIVLEDTHWADNSSLECISLIVNRFWEATGSVLVVLTARPEEIPNTPELFEDKTVNLVNLEDLDDKDRRSLIIQELGELCTDELTEQVAKKAGGNPFYICEICRSLKETSGKDLKEIPSSVRGIVASRVDRLPSRVKRVLQYATVIGPTFREPVLSKLLGSNPARALAVLRNRGVLFPRLSAALVDDGIGKHSEHYEREWIFRHVLVQEVVHESLGATTRSNLHRDIAQIILNRIDRGYSDSPAEAARHLELSGHKTTPPHAKKRNTM